MYVNLKKHDPQNEEREYDLRDNEIFSPTQSHFVFP